MQNHGRFYEFSSFNFVEVAVTLTHVPMHIDSSLVQSSTLYAFTTRVCSLNIYPSMLDFDLCFRYHRTILILQLEPFHTQFLFSSYIYICTYITHITPHYHRYFLSKLLFKFQGFVFDLNFFKFSVVNNCNHVSTRPKRS